MSERRKEAHVIVVGNEKGGTGKSTTAMHIAISLLNRELLVAVIDLDTRQRSLARYLENRSRFAGTHHLNLRQPEAVVVLRSELDSISEREIDERRRFDEALSSIQGRVDFILIDCPGSDHHLSRLAHARADTLLTPLNDSFVDLDLIGQVNPETYQVDRLSLYSESVWESRKQRALSGRRGLDWVVMRNRTGHMDAYNRRRVDAALDQLQKRIAFRYVPGLSERVIFRELFPKGLTLVDLKQAGGQKMTMSHVAARQELRRLMDDLRLPGWNSPAAVSRAGRTAH